MMGTDEQRAVRSPIAPQWKKGVREFWYVKARNIITGEEIQRLAELADQMFGSSAATAEMKMYLIGAGRAKPDFSDWEIVEVQRADRRPGAETNGPYKRF
jgi:hypothetical protein